MLSCPKNSDVRKNSSVGHLEQRFLTDVVCLASLQPLWGGVYDLGVNAS